MTDARPLARATAACLSLLGLVFWFAVGFPFEHHNESFNWAVFLHDLPLKSWITDHVVAFTYRPLAQGTAWILYRGFGDAPYGVQLFNVSIACVAWLIAVLTSPNRRTFSIGALMVGGVFFSGYIYLFHVHGVFYSPVLVQVAVLLAASTRPSWRAHAGYLTAFSLVCALYHPFALVILLSFLAGTQVEVFGRRLQGSLVVAAVLAMVSLAMVLSGALPSPKATSVREALTSLQMVEVHSAVSIALWAVSGVTWMSFPATRRLRLAGLAILGGGAVLLKLLGFPAALLWIGACLGKVVVLRRWVLASLLSCTTLLTLSTATGTPTYTVFALLVCCFILSVEADSFEAALAPRFRALATATIATAACVAVSLRLGASLPWVSDLARPLLAERERTAQMRLVLDEIVRSPGLRDEYVNLPQRHATPTRAPQLAIDRRFKAPTHTTMLNNYLEHVLYADESPGSRLMTMSLVFGGEVVEGGRLLVEVPGRYAGPARLYELPPGSEQLE